MISVFWICGSWPEVLTISPFERILREQSWDGSKVITTISRGAWRNISQNGHLVALNLATNIPLIILPVSLSFTVYIIYCRSSIFDIVKFWFRKNFRQKFWFDKIYLFFDINLSLLGVYIFHIFFLIDNSHRKRGNVQDWWH